MGGINRRTSYTITCCPITRCSIQKSRPRTCPLVTPKFLRHHLSLFFVIRGSDCSVVLLDELDQLVMAKQTVLYNLFNWPTLPHSRLIVIAIANTMNLADMLPNKIQSRVGICPSMR